MLTYNNQFEFELKKLIEEEIVRISENVLSGIGVPDYADYKHQTGKITGLRMAVELCDEAQAILARR